MASLTHAAISARKAVRFSLYGLIFLIMARFVFNLGASIYRRYIPQKEPTPTVAFGKLPKLPFPEKDSPKDLSYKVETADGKLPKFAGQMKVYFMPEVNPNLGQLDKAKTIAKGLGFLPEGKILTESVPNVYIFGKKDVPSNLTMNIVTGVFSISYDMNSDQSVIGTNPPIKESAVKQIQSFLGRGKLLADDLKEGPVTYEFLKVVNRNLQTVVSLSEADFIKVNIFRTNLEEKIPSMPPDPKEANVWFILSGSKEKDKQVIAGEYHYFSIDMTKTGTYPIVSADDALEILKSGGAFIASAPTNTKEITLRKAYLAYYDAGQYTQFMQPIVVFEGDNDFVAYVPAISPKFYGSETQE